MHLLPVIWIKITFHFASCPIRLYGVSRNYGNHSCVLDESKTFLALYSASVRLFCSTIASYTIAYDLQFLKKEENASWKCWMLVGWKQTALHLCAICASCHTSEDTASRGTLSSRRGADAVINAVNKYQGSTFKCPLGFKSNQPCSTDGRTDGRTDRHEMNTCA